MNNLKLVKKIDELEDTATNLRMTIKELTDGVAHFHKSRGDMNPLLEAYIKALAEMKSWSI
jgi:uncharacterized coiled-coil protein SlyX